MAIDAPAMYRSSPLHAGALGAVDDALEQHKPANVCAEEIVVTGEGESVCIVLIPHHQLGGVALIVWSDIEGVHLRWGLVTTLLYHDEIDLAVHVGKPISPREAGAVTRAISAEMARPIKVRLRPRKFGKARLECSVDFDGRPEIIGRLPLGGDAGFVGAVTTTLTEGILPVEVAVPFKGLRASL